MIGNVSENMLRLEIRAVVRSALHPKHRRSGYVHAGGVKVETASDVSEVQKPVALCIFFRIFKASDLTQQTFKVF